MAEVWAETGYPEDIQAAVNAIRVEGGTVYVPEGDFPFIYTGTIGVTSYGGVNIVGLGTTLRAKPQPRNSKMFWLEGSNGKRLGLSGMNLIGDVVYDPATETDDKVNNVGVYIHAAKDFRVHHNRFVDFAGKSVISEAYSDMMRGVVDHNIIDNPYKDIYPYNSGFWAYGILVVGKAYQWEQNINNLLGKYETLGQTPIVYIEDNILSRCRHSIASSQGVWYVARYNKFYEPRPKNFGMIDVHGLAGYDAPGGRGLEAYNNEVHGAPGYSSNAAMWLRGGGGVVHHNVFIDSTAAAVSLFDDSALGKPPPTYARVKDLYIWGNTYQNSKQLASGPYTENIDYFLSERVGYVPYPYPHPLTLGKNILSIHSSPITGIPFTVRRIS